MPAIQPALLRKQAAMLAEHFDNPAAYIRSLHHLLDFYADRSVQAGRSGSPSPITPAYKVREPVLRIILQELIPYAQEDPTGGLELCNRLWNEPYLEFRLLAAMLLGQIRPDPPEPIFQLLNTWLVPDLEFYLIEALMQDSLSRIRKEQPQAIIELIQVWLEQKEPAQQQLGLRALLPLIGEPDFENIPVFFRLIQPFVKTVPSGLRPDLLDVIAALAKRSPHETAYFLIQTLSIPGSQETPWLIRQLIEEFPPGLQSKLRAAEIKSHFNR